MCRCVFPLPAAFLLFASVMPAALGDVATPAEPQIFAGDAKWDFGEVVEGFVARGEIALENRGGAPLRILNIRATCTGCSAGAATEEPIPPGGKTALRIQFNTAGYSGKQERVLYLHSNDPKTPFTQVKVVGTVRRDSERPVVALSEDSWDAEVIMPGQVIEKSFRIRNDGKRDLQIKGVLALEPLSASCGRATLAAGEEGEIKVRLEPKGYRGIINEQVVVNTSDPISPSKTIHVTGYAAKVAPAAGKSDGAVIILPRDPVRLPGTDRAFYREYEIRNNTGSPITVRCLSAEGHTRLDVDDVAVDPGGLRVVRAVPGATAPEDDRLSLRADLAAYPSKQGTPEK